MAYIRQHKDKWRAEVFKHGTRASKLFKDRTEAEHWARSLERSLGDAVERARLGNGVVKDYDSPILLSSLPRRVLDAVQQVPYSLLEIVGSSYVHGTGVGVYFLLLDREVVYVGQTIDFLARLHRHKRDKEKDFNAFAFIQCKEDQLDALESLYIDAFLPRYNRTTSVPSARFRDRN